MTPDAMSVNAASPTYGTGSGEAVLAASLPAAATTCTIGKLNTLAKSKSRSSCAGTAMIAPVP